MRDLAAEHGIFDFEGKLARGSNAAVSGERTAEHERAFGQTAIISDMALDQGVRGDPRGRHAIKDWRSRWALHPQRLQFLDVLLDRRRIASGPAGDDSLLDRDLAGPCTRLGLQRERENTQRHDTFR